MRPSVSVIVPTQGDRLKWLRESLASVAVQEVGVQLIVVCPAESAEAMEVAGQFNAVVLNDPGDGLSAALNIGLRQATAPYLTWLGDDDMLARGSFAHTVEALDRNPRAVMVYGQNRVIGPDGRMTFVMKPGRFGAFFMRVAQQFVPQPGSLLRTEVVRKLGGIDETLRYAMDTDLFLRLRQVGRLMYLRRELAAYRRHPATLTETNPRPGQESRDVRLRYLSRFARTTEPFWFPAARFVARWWGRVQYRQRRSSLSDSAYDFGDVAPPS